METIEVLVAETAAIADCLRRYNARGETLQALVQSLASQRPVPSRVLSHARAARRVHERLLAGLTLTMVEIDVWADAVTALRLWVDTAEFAQGAESSHQAPRRVKTERLPSKWTQPWIVATVLVPLIAVTGIVLHNTGIDRAHAPGSQQSSAPLGQPQVKRDNQRPPHAPRNPTHRTDAAA